MVSGDLAAKPGLILGASAAKGLHRRGPPDHEAVAGQAGQRLVQPDLRVDLPPGEELIDALVSRNMPIDLAHASERARKQIMIRTPKDYGLYDSHTKFERLMRPDPGQKDYGTPVLDREQEFLIMESILPEYTKHKVLVGLRPTSIDVYDAPGAKVPNDCPGSAKSFAQLVQYADDSGLPIAYGTDFNTGVAQLGPRMGPGRCWAARDDVEGHTERPVGSERAERKRRGANRVQPIDGTDYYVDGVAHIGWLPELTEDLVFLGAPGARKLRKSAEAYIQMWERAHDAEKTTGGPSEAPMSVNLGGACNADDHCRSGRCSGFGGGRGVCVCNEDDDCGPDRWCNMGTDLKVNACEQ